MPRLASHTEGGTWNDEGNLSNISGYVAELGTPVVPEPSSLVLLVAGVALLGWTVRGRPLRRPIA